MRTRAERKQKRKTEEAITTRCVHINTARPASNPNTLTLPPANRGATSSRREKKTDGRERRRVKTRKGTKTHQMDSMADHASTKTKIDRDVIVQLSSFHQRPRPSGRRQTPSDTPTSRNCAISHFRSARHLVSSATRLSACLLAPRNVRVQLLSHATAAISCFSGSGAKQ